MLFNIERSLSLLLQIVIINKNVLFTYKQQQNKRTVVKEHKKKKIRTFPNVN